MLLLNMKFIVKIYNTFRTIPLSGVTKHLIKFNQKAIDRVKLTLYVSIWTKQAEFGIKILLYENKIKLLSLILHL